MSFQGADNNIDEPVTGSLLDPAVANLSDV